MLGTDLTDVLEDSILKHSVPLQYREDVLTGGKDWSTVYTKKVQKKVERYFWSTLVSPRSL